MTEEIKNINSKVLAFGLMSILSIFLMFVIVLIIFLYSTTSKLYDSQDRVLEQTALIKDLQRSLHTIEGRVSVYDNFLTGTQAGTIRRLVRKFLREEKVKSDEVTLVTFESWIYAKSNRSYDGMGGR